MSFLFSFVPRLHSRKTVVSSEHGSLQRPSQETVFVAGTSRGASVRHPAGSAPGSKAPAASPHELCITFAGCGTSSWPANLQASSPAWLSAHLQTPGTSDHATPLGRLKSAAACGRALRHRMANLHRSDSLKAAAPASQLTWAWLACHSRRFDLAWCPQT